MPGKKEPERETIEDLVDNAPYFETTMQEFFRRGQMQSLQRWFRSAGTRTKAYKIADHMAARFYDKLVEVMPDFGEEK
jgi:hypothetical protein